MATADAQIWLGVQVETRAGLAALDEIAATPGVDFDRDRGHHFMRFSFAGSTDDMTEAVKRLKAWQ